MIVWLGAIPLETDILNTNRNVMTALGFLIQDLLGTTTLAAGLACTPGSGLNVSVAPGRLYALENVDGTAYSSLAADTTHQIVKQGILLDAATLAVPAPTTGGDSINYLIEATFQSTDTNAVILDYYNASNPTTPYTGPNNTGQAQATVRAGQIALVAKAGTQAATGTQATPAPDSGYVGLWVVSVPFGASSILSSEITPYAGAPIIPSSGIFSHSLAAPAASPVTGIFSDTAAVIDNSALASFTYDLPAISAVPTGWRSPLLATLQAGIITVAPSGTDKIATKAAGASLASSSAAGNNLRLRAGRSQTWLIESQVGTWS
ncbi:MAG TPA: hypothetical protein VN719_07180 [Gemmatimonadales bacterium]|nr:hypothetical protein [Gemmatimonadales bacterium]